MNRTYSELIGFRTFAERFNYLKLDGKIGQDIFGFDRYLNQNLYTSAEWRTLRNKIIVRDNGCDLAFDGHEIFDKIIIHHINPITPDDLKNNTAMVFDPENLITVDFRTHNALHFGDDSILSESYIERRPNDTCPWRR